MPKIPGVAGPVSAGAAAGAGGMFCRACCVLGPLGTLSPESREAMLGLRYNRVVPRARKD